MWNTCHRTLFCSTSNALPAGLFFHSVICPFFPSPVIGTSHSMKAGTLAFQHWSTVTICLLCYVKNTPSRPCLHSTLYFSSSTRPNFLFFFYSHHRQRLLSTQTKCTSNHCITSQRLIWLESLDHKVFLLLCWQVKSSKNKNNLLKRTQCDCSTHYLARKFTCKGLLECVNWYVLCECLFLLSS